ncbi:MAG: GIY-YIG nuclease family protein [Clostridia bacterium]|nr:GIY-YIG nuclease family protein [Clostridia bacterium]
MDKKEYIVYCHINKITAKTYVGITKQAANKRWYAGEGYKRQAFYKVVQEYGWDNFEHLVLMEGLNKEEAEYFETFYIDYYDSCENGYNVDLAEGPINALCGEYYRENGIVPIGEELKKLYRTKKTVDLEQLKWMEEFIKKYGKDS